MDYLRPIEALIPGARGRILQAMVTNTGLQSIRGVAKRANVSSSRAGQILEDLVDLGIVERQAAGGQALVRLVSDNSAARYLSSCAEQVWIDAVDELRRGAGLIRPAPVTLTLFGSFARRAAARDSDVDVLAVHDDDVSPPWDDELESWRELAARATGNPVNVIDLSASELDQSSTEAWLQAALREGLVLAGEPLG